MRERAYPALCEGRSSKDQEVRLRAVRLLRLLDLQRALMETRLSYTQDGALFVVDLPNGASRKLLHSWTESHEWMPGGKEIVCCHHGDRYRLLMVDPRTGSHREIRLPLEKGERLVLVEPSPDGTFLAVASEYWVKEGVRDFRLQVVHQARGHSSRVGETIPEPRPEREPLPFGWSSDRELVAIVEMPGTPRSWSIARYDAVDGKVETLHGPINDGIRSIAVSPGTDRVAAIVYTGREYQKSLLLILGNRTETLHFESENEYLGEVAWAPDRETILFQSRSARPVDRMRVLAIRTPDKSLTTLSDDPYDACPTLPLMTKDGFVQGTESHGRYGLRWTGRQTQETTEFSISAELARVNPTYLRTGFIPLWLIKNAGPWQDFGCSQSRLPGREETLTFALFDPTTQQVHRLLGGLDFSSKRIGQRAQRPWFSWRVSWARP